MTCPSAPTRAPVSGASYALKTSTTWFQDVLLSVHLARATYNPTRPFLPWLLAIVRNRLADAARLHASRSAHEVLVDEIDVTFPSDQPNYLTEGYREPQALKRASRRGRLSA